MEEGAVGIVCHRSSVHRVYRQDLVVIAMVKSLLPYQITGAKTLRKMERGILADEMGLGKTIQAIAAAATKHNKSILIITLNGLQTNWRSEIEDLLGKGQSIEVYDGKQVIGEARWVIIHYEGAKLERNLKVLKSKNWDVVIVDEAHRCKNRKRKTKQGNVTNYGLVDSLSSKCKGMFLLTGTPMKGDPADVWPLLHFVDRDRYRSFWSWIYKYVDYEKTYFGNKPVGYKNLDLLSEEMGVYCVRRKKSEVIRDLPKKNIHTVKCSMTAKQNRIYDQMMSEYVAELDSRVYMSAPAEVSRIMRLRQIATDASILSEDTNRLGHYIESGKMNVLYELVKKIVFENDEKVVIFTNWESLVRRICGLIGDWPCKVVTYTGNTSKTDREDAVWSFQNDPETKIFVATIGAAGTGLTLTAASKMIFTDRSWTPDDNAQAEDRIYARMNDVHGADIYKLITEGTVDEQIDEYIGEKEATVNQVISHVRNTILR